MPELNADLIRRILENEGLSREDLESLCDVKLRTIDKALAQKSVSAHTHSEIAAALRIDPPLLLLRSGVEFTDLSRDSTGVYSCSRPSDSSIPGRERSRVEAQVFDMGKDALGISVESETDPDEAIANAEELLAKGNPTVRDLNLAGVFLALAGLNRRAREHFERAVALDSRDYHAWLNLGRCHEILGARNEAVTAYLNALNSKGDYQWLKHFADSEMPEDVRAAANQKLNEYQSTLDERTVCFERAVIDVLRKEDDTMSETENQIDFYVTSYNVEPGVNATRFVIEANIGTAVALCFGEPEDAVSLLMPFRPPCPEEFKKQELRFVDYFGYERFEASEGPEDEDEEEALSLFVAKIPCSEIAGTLLFKWLLRSFLFQMQGEAFLNGEPFLEVLLDD